MQKRGVVTCTLGTINHCGGVGHRFFTYFFFPRWRGTCFFISSATWHMLFFLSNKAIAFFFLFPSTTYFFLTHTKYGVVAKPEKIVLRGQTIYHCGECRADIFNEVLAFFPPQWGICFFFPPRLGYFLFFFRSAPLPFFSRFCPTPPPPTMINGSSSMACYPN